MWNFSGASSRVYSFLLPVECEYSYTHAHTRARAILWLKRKACDVATPSEHRANVHHSARALEVPQERSISGLMKAFAACFPPSPPQPDVEQTKPSQRLIFY